QDAVDTLATGALRAAALPAALREVFADAAEMEEGVAMRGRNEDHGTAPAAVPAVGSASRNVLLTPEGAAAIAALAADHPALVLVEEHGGLGRPDAARRPRAAERVREPSLRVDHERVDVDPAVGG